MASSPASFQLQYAAKRMSAELLPAGNTSASRWCFEEADAAALAFTDDTVLGTVSDMQAAQSPILALHSSAGIVECNLSRSTELRSSSFMPAYSPMPVNGATETFTFPKLGTPEAVAVPAPPTPQQGDAVANPYAALTQFLAGAKYSTPMPAGAYGISPDDVQHDAASAKTGNDCVPSKQTAGATPDLWQAVGQSSTHEAEAECMSPQLGGTDGAFTFGCAPVGTPAATPRFGVGSCSPVQTAASPSIFAAAGLRSNNASTPVPFCAAMSAEDGRIVDIAGEASNEAALASPFSAMKWQYRHEADKVRDVQSAQAHIRLLHDAFTNAMPRQAAPSVPDDVPPPGTPPYKQLLRHLNGSKRTSKGKQGGQSEGAAAAAQAEKSTADSDQSAAATAGDGLSAAASSAVGTAAIAVANQQVTRQQRQEQCVAMAAGTDKAAAPAIQKAAAEHSAVNDPPSAGASWLPFASLVSNIVAHRYKSPMLRFGANSSPAAQHDIAAGKESPACKEASGSSVGTPQPVLRCPLSDRQSASGDKSSGEQSQRKLQSLNFSGASDTNECSPVSGLAKSALTCAQTRSPQSQADESASPPLAGADFQCCSPPFPEVPMRAMPEEGEQAGSPLLDVPNASTFAHTAHGPGGAHADLAEQADFAGTAAEGSCQLEQLQEGHQGAPLAQQHPDYPTAAPTIDAHGAGTVSLANHCGTAVSASDDAEHGADVTAELADVHIDQEEQATLQAAAAADEQAPDDESMMRMSVMSDTVLMGDITPRDSEGAGNSIPADGMASTTSGTCKLAPVPEEAQAAEDGAVDAQDDPPFGVDWHEPTPDNSEHAAAWQQWQCSMHGGASIEAPAPEVDSPASPALRPHSDMPELRQSASPDLHGVLAFCKCVVGHFVVCLGCPVCRDCFAAAVAVTMVCTSPPLLPQVFLCACQAKQSCGWCWQ